MVLFKRHKTFVSSYVYTIIHVYLILIPQLI
jgi:hypothetical protein